MVIMLGLKWSELDLFKMRYTLQIGSKIYISQNEIIRWN